MIPRPRWRGFARRRRGTAAPRRDRSRAGLGVEDLEPRFLLRGPELALVKLPDGPHFVTILPTPTVGPVAEATPASNPSPIRYSGPSHPSASGESAASATSTATASASHGSGRSPALIGIPTDSGALVVASARPSEIAGTTTADLPDEAIDPSGPVPLPAAGPGDTILLPDGPSISVVGTVGPEVVKYLLPTDPDTTHIRLEMRMLQFGRPMDAQVTVSSDSGQMLGDMIPGPGSQDMTLDIPMSRVGPGNNGLLIQVAAVGTVPASWAQQGPYLLQVTRFSSAGFRTSLSAGGNLGESSGTLPLWFRTPTPSSTTTSEGEATPPPEESAATVGVLEGPIPTGPLPARSAAPLGGLLGDDDPTPAVDRRDAVALALEEIDLSAEGAVAEPAADEAEPTGRLVAVRGPGGFPLLASARSVGPEGPIAAPLPALPRLWATPSVADASPAPASGSALPPPEPDPPRPKSGRSFRASIGSGLTFALSLAFGLMLPDLAAAFQADEPPRDRDRDDDEE